MSAKTAYNKLQQMKESGATHYTLMREAMKLSKTGYDHCIEDDMVAAYFDRFVILITFNCKITLLEETE